MQYLLTEEEYAELTTKAKSASLLSTKVEILSEELDTIRDMYNRLLVYGVSTTNERLKQQ